MDPIGERDILIFFTDDNGNELNYSPKRYGILERDDVGNEIILTNNGNLAIVGTSTDSNSNSDVIFFLIDSQGNLQ